MLFILGAALAADPTPVVAMGDAWVAPDALPGGWVAVLADCLEERAKGRYSVVDRATAGQDPQAARSRLGPILDLAPGLVLVGVSAPASVDNDAARAFEDALGALGRDITGRGSVTLLVGVVEPAGGRYNEVVERVAGQVPGVVHVDLAKDWPRDDAQRDALAIKTWLTDQGHARVGAAACDAVLAYKKP